MKGIAIPIYLRHGVIREIIAGLFIFLFAYTGINKLFHYSDFAAALSGSSIIGDKARIAAIGIPIINILIAFLLFLPRTRRYGLAGALALMILYSTYVAWALFFSTHLPCRCAGILNWLTWKQQLIFNVIITAIAIMGVITGSANKQHQYI